MTTRHQTTDSTPRAEIVAGDDEDHVFPRKHRHRFDQDVHLLARRQLAEEEHDATRIEAQSTTELPTLDRRLELGEVDGIGNDLDLRRGNAETQKLPPLRVAD